MNHVHSEVAVSGIQLDTMKLGERGMILVYLLEEAVKVIRIMSVGILLLIHLGTTVKRRMVSRIPVLHTTMRNT